MKLVNVEAKSAVEDMHRGLHLAMAALLTNRDKDEAERILRQLDAVMAGFLNEVRISR